MTDDPAEPTPKTPPIAELEELDRSGFADLNPYDRIYRTASGYVVKVRLLHHRYTPGWLIYKLSGSWVDENTGKAHPHGDGHFIVGEWEVQSKPEAQVCASCAMRQAAAPETPLTVAELVALGTREVVKQLESAILVHEEHTALMTAGQIKLQEVKADDADAAP